MNELNNYKMIFEDNIKDWVVGQNRWKNITQNKQNSDMEKEWITQIYPEYENKKQWTTDFSENKLVLPVLEILYGKVNKPKKIQNLQPDWETIDTIWEVKCRTWCTSGTAGEKILSGPYKYASVPVLYKNR